MHPKVHYNGISKKFRKELEVAQITAVSSYLFTASFTYNFVTTKEAQNSCQKDHWSKQLNLGLLGWHFQSSYSFLDTLLVLLSSIWCCPITLASFLPPCFPACLTGPFYAGFPMLSTMLMSTGSDVIEACVFYRCIDSKQFAMVHKILELQINKAIC